MAEAKLVVGLGNPGSAYSGTRHNIGFEVVDAVAEALGTDVRKRKFGGRLGSTEYSDKRILLLKPWRYMNRSGGPCATARGFYKLALSDVLVVTDDLALEIGQLRLRPKGSAGGHNGLRDIIDELGSEEFARLRVGIGASGVADTVKYVLSRPSAEERKVLDGAVQRAKDAVFCWIERGIDEAMNRFNQPAGN
jgi:PTH1 family peptidyl-tRNA hydrolase